MWHKDVKDKGIRNQILTMILPITAENILQMTAGAVSMAMVSRISEVAVGAIGISNVIFRIIWSIFKGLATGTSVFVAQSYGANNHDRLKRVSVQGFYLAVGLSVILQQILFWNAENLLRIFNPTEELMSNGILYLRIISWSLPFTAVILLVAGILQGMGNARTPMFIIGILNIVNILFSYLFIFGNLGFPVLGLRGAGYAYLFAYVTAALIGLFSLFSKEGALRKLSGNFVMKFKVKEAGNLIKFGLPTSFETSFWAFASIFITKAILTYGETAYAAYQLGLQAEAISYMPATGFGIAATTFIGQSLGKKDKELGKRYLKELLNLTIMITIVAGGALILFPKLIMGILTDDVESIRIGAGYLFVMGIVQMPQNLAGLLNGALRGAGYPKVTMVNAGIGLWLIRLPFIMLMAFVFKADIAWIWIGMGLDLVCRFFLSYFTFKRKDIFNKDIALVE